MFEQHQDATVTLDRISGLWRVDTPALGVTPYKGRCLVSAYTATFTTHESRMVIRVDCIDSYKDSDYWHEQVKGNEHYKRIHLAPNDSGAAYWHDTGKPVSQVCYLVLLACEGCKADMYGMRPP